MSKKNPHSGTYSRKRARTDRFSLYEFIMYEIKHYRVSIYGIRVQNFFNTLMKNNIYLRNIRLTDESEVICDVSILDIDTVYRLAGNKYDVQIVAEHGIMVVMSYVLRRKGLIVGAMLVAGILFVQQSFITEIMINGNVSITDSEVRTILDKNEFVKGRQISKIDKENMENTLLREFPELTWVNVNFKGSCAFIDLVEDEKSEKAEDMYANDIVADKSGYIEQIDVKNGTGLVKKGDYVNRGDVLISARMLTNNLTFDESRTDTYRNVPAKGDIKAIITYKLTCKVAENKYTEIELKSKINTAIKRFLYKNVPDYLELKNKSLKFNKEENIIECNITLLVLEKIGEKRRIEFAESGK